MDSYFSFCKVFDTFLIFCTCFLAPSLQYATLCQVYDGQVNMTYRHEITAITPVVYLYTLDPYLTRDPGALSIRVDASAGRSADLECPLLFTIAQYQEMSNFQLPYKFRGSNELYYEAGKTLCIPRRIASPARNVTIRISTCSNSRIYVDFKLSIAFDLLKSDGSVTTTHITPTKANFLKFRFNPDANPEKSQVVRLLATSPDHSCMTLSVQDLSCPIYDKESNVEHNGFWQTMTTQGAMAVSSRDFPGGFVVVLVLHHDNHRCSQGPAQTSRTGSSSNARFSNIWSKEVSISLRDERDTPRGYIFLALMIPVFCTILSILLTCLLFQNRHNWLVKTTKTAFMLDFHGVDNETMIKQPISDARNSSNGIERESTVIETDLDAVDDGLGDEDADPEHLSIEEQEPMQRSQSFPSHLEIPSGIAPTSNSIWQWKASLNIAQLQRKDPERILKGSNRFYWTVVIVSVFYAIPVYQLILHYLRVVNRTGEFDICYYNYLCSYRVGLFSDFNHFWSNVSYIIFGIAFNFIVGRRERNLRLRIDEIKEVSAGRALRSDEDGMGQCYKCSCIPEKCLCSCCCFSVIHGRIDHGVPFHFGVFYAMGLALIMEGLLSAAYHLCPNQSNFQFDTCFMYVIAVLTILKVYQFRHPIHLGANQIFGILALFVSASVVGLILEVYDSSSGVLIAYRWIFYVGFIITCVIMFVHFYAIGYVRDDENGQAMGSVDVLVNLNKLPRTVQIDRLILPIISLSLSIGIIIYSEVAKVHFATYLLYTLIGNVLGTSIYYIGIMKPLHGEFKNWTWVQPVIYFATAVIVGVIAVYYFLSVLTQWEVSPSASRAINEECKQGWFPFLPFYDNHDIWHFLSAGALFFGFMGLLIVDDDLLTTPQKNIPVF